MTWWRFRRSPATRSRATSGTRAAGWRSPRTRRWPGFSVRGAAGSGLVAQGVLEVLATDDGGLVPERVHLGPRAERLDVPASHSLGLRGEVGEVDARVERRTARVELQQPEPVGAIGQRHLDVLTQPAAGHDRGVEQVEAVRGPDHQDALGRLEPVQLGQELVERRVVGTTGRVAAAATASGQGVDLVDEHHGRAGFAGLAEQVADLALRLAQPLAP